MTQLSTEQLQAIAKNPRQPLTVEDPETRIQYVIVKLEEFKKMQDVVQRGNGRFHRKAELLKQAILNRRDESRRLNDEWEHVDSETWPKDDVQEQ